MVMFKILDKTSKTISAHFKDLKYFYRKYFHKNARKIQENSTLSKMASLMILPVSCHGEQCGPTKPSQNHFCPFSSLNNFTLPNMPKCSKTWCTCSNGLIIHLYQMGQVGEKVILIKVPQNPLCPEPNLNNFTLATFSF